MRLVAWLTVTIIAATALAGCSDSEDQSDNRGPTPTSTTASASGGECEYVETEKASKEVDLPPSDPQAVDSLTITTNQGNIVVTLDAQAAPCAVNSFVSLAKQRYFDTVKCHRLVEGFVLQCGDPTATGGGGPGYSFKDELTGEEKYTVGTVAMANSGPDTNGSQFFIVLADQPTMPANYTVFGSIDDAGMAVAKRVEAAGAAPNETPNAETVIASVS